MTDRHVCFWVFSEGQQNGKQTSLSSRCLWQHT